MHVLGEKRACLAPSAIWQHKVEVTCGGTVLPWLAAWRNTAPSPFANKDKKLLSRWSRLAASAPSLTWAWTPAWAHVQQCPWDVLQCHWTGFLSSADSHAGYEPSNRETNICPDSCDTWVLSASPPRSTFTVHCRRAHPHRHRRKGDPGYKTMNMKHGQPQEEVSTENIDGIEWRNVTNVCMNPTNSILYGLSGQQQPARKSSIKTSINPLTVSLSYLLSGFISFK